MPTTDDYRLGAREVRQAAAEVECLAIEFERSRVVGSVGLGPVAEVVQGWVDAAVGEMRASIESLHQFAAECDLRAAICDDFAVRWDAWRWTPYERPEPQPPFTWVDRK